MSVPYTPVHVANLDECLQHLPGACDSYVEAEYSLAWVFVLAYLIVFLGGFTLGLSYAQHRKLT